MGQRSDTSCCHNKILVDKVLTFETMLMFHILKKINEVNKDGVKS